jgi:hypothetical protein
VKSALVARGQREDGENLVAVDDVAPGVDGEAPVGVTVERESRIGAVLHHRLLKIAHVRGPAPLVDVVAVGLGVNGQHRGPETVEDVRSDLERRAVRTVENDREAVEPGWVVAGGDHVTVSGGDRRYRVDEVLDVRGDTGLAVADAADVGAGGPGPRLLETVLDEDFDVVVELVSSA